jgi:predicted RNA methylase
MAREVVYDLGAGDGRVVIAATAKFGAGRAIGAEAAPGGERAAHTHWA